MEYLTSIYSLENNVDGDYLGIQEQPESSPSSSSESPPHQLSNPSSSYSPMSNASRESEFVPFTLEDLKIETSMDGMGGQHLMKPFLRIMEQPVDKFRFRYKSEMHGTHGALMGISSSKTRKSFPTVELCNFAGDAIIQCSLYQADLSGRKMHHSHKLVIRQDNVDIDDPHRQNVNQFRGYSVQFKGMGIIHTAKKHIADELYRKLKTQEQSRGMELSYRQETQLKEKAERESKSMNLNQVCLCFQAMIENSNGQGLVPICEPVYSKCINNLKSALTGELKICRLSTAVSSAVGQELFMFVEKVGKKNIKVKFYELDENGDEVWCDWGNFTEIDVHHQYAIALTTPPYRNTDITSPVDVFIQLYRPSDEDYSEPMPFKYKPRDNTNPRKRQRIATSFPSSEIPLVLERMSHATTMMPPPTPDELHKMQIINDLIPTTNEDYSFSGISSADLTDLQLLTCDGEKSGSGSDSEEVAEQTLQIEEEFEKLAKIYRLFGSDTANHSSMRDKILAVMKEYFEKYGREASFLQDLLGYGDDTRVRQVIQMLNKLSLDDLLKEIDPYNNSNLLHTVCAKNKPQFIRALAHAGLDPNKQDNDGNSPLHLAVSSSSTACVQALLQLPLTEVFNNEGYSPIHIAVKARHLPITRLLLQADFNVTSGERRQGNSALHLAVLSKSLKSCEMILEKSKISIDTKNSSDFSALEVAKALASDEDVGDELKQIIHLLEKNGGPENEKSDPVAMFENATVTNSAADNKSRQGVESLLNQGKQWKELAHSLGMDHVVCVCETSNNPAGTLFNLIEFESVDPQRIRTAISTLKNIESGHILNALEKILIR